MSNAQTSSVPALIIRRTFDAPRERVFAAWTSPELLRAWFGPPGTTMREATFEAREGGRYRLELTSSDREPYGVGGTITEYRKPERLAFSFRWEESDPKDEHDTFVTIDLIDNNGKTDMVFKQEALASAASRERHDQGWSGSFDRLSANALAAPAVRVRGIDLSGYMCKDAERAMRFYRDVFGLEPTMVYPENRGAEYDLPDGTTFGLWGGGGKVMPFQPSNGVMFAVEDLEAAIAAVTARGITVNYRGQTPNCTLAMINDSEGNIITLHQRNG